MNRDLLLYLVHGLFWAAFGVTRIVLRRGTPAPAVVTVTPAPATPATPAAPTAPTAPAARTAPWSRGVLAVHVLAFAVMYFGIGSAVVPGQVPFGFAGQRVAGTLVMVGGSALMCWALAHFASWRFRARLDAGHRLATGGPFRWLRHPIYMGMNLLALGSAIWVPTPVLWTAFLLMVVGSDLRARAEEKLLTLAFGPAYVDYRTRVSRFVPGVY